MSVRDSVLEALTTSTEPVSGEWLARKLGVSRSAVWKVIKALRDEGFEIDAANNRGYTLKTHIDMLDDKRFLQALETETFGRNIRFYRETASTNDVAKHLATEDAPHGTLVAAMSQTSGRGRFGRHFHSPTGSGIYFSFILRPTIPADRAVLITSMAAVAVARAIEHFVDVDVKIKWVNDLYINDRKICGILSEAELDFETMMMRYVVVGIGINVGVMEFPEELKEIATSIGNECGRDIPKNELLAEICRQMEQLSAELPEAYFMREYSARSNVIGRDIIVLRGGERFPAHAVAIDPEGSLIVETDSGRKTVRSGEISIRFR